VFESLPEAGRWSEADSGWGRQEGGRTAVRGERGPDGGRGEVGVEAKVLRAEEAGGRRRGRWPLAVAKAPWVGWKKARGRVKAGLRATGFRVLGVECEERAKRWRDADGRSSRQAGPRRRHEEANERRITTELSSRPGPGFRPPPLWYPFLDADGGGRKTG
jgi:hypothetical protein